MSTSRKRDWRATTGGEYAAEVLGTFILIAFGTGVVAMAVAALNQSGRGDVPFQASGDWLLITFGWGFAVTFAAYTAGGISGAHLNPAVTLAFALRRGFPWNKVPGYWLAQLVGAFLGAALVYWVYHDAIHSYEVASKITRGEASGAGTFGIFGTTPAPYFHNIWGPLLDQIVGTAFLVAFIFALTDEYNSPVKSNLGPLLVGFVVVAIGMSFGANAGYAINPARDLGPRLLAFVAGWKDSALPGNYMTNFGEIKFYLWVPIVGPLIGAAVGAFIYDAVIRNVLLARGTKPDPDLVDSGVEEIETGGRVAPSRTTPPDERI